MPGKPKGLPKTGGRKKGSPNKFTKIKHQIIEAFSELGGKGFVLDCAKSDPIAVLKVVAGILPKEVEADVKGNITLTWEKE